MIRRDFLKAIGLLAVGGVFVASETTLVERWNLLRYKPVNATSFAVNLKSTETDLWGTYTAIIGGKEYTSRFQMPLELTTIEHFENLVERMCYRCTEELDRRAFNAISTQSSTYWDAFKQYRGEA